jgi:plasmid stability protein
MAQVIVRNLEEEVKTSLKQRAQQHGWSMEEEVRQILRQAVYQSKAPSPGLGTRVSQRFAQMGLSEPLPELHGESFAAMDLGP